MKKINSYFLITRKKIPAYLKYYWSKITSEIKTKVEGIPPLILLKSSGKNLINYLIYGNSVQDGTPTPSNPIEIESVGDLVTDTNDVNYGKYKIPVIARGKNLFDDTTLSNKWVNISGSIVDLPKANCKRFECVEGETYTLFASYETKNASNIIVMAFYDSNDTLLIRNTVSNLEYEELIKTAPQNSKYFYAGYYTIEPQTIQLEKSDIATEYEPYIEPTTTNIYLDEPLRKVGNYADYLDFKNQKVFRNVIVNDDTGTQTIENSYTGTTDSSGTSISLPNIPTIKGTTIFEIDTEIQPSKIEVEYLRGG